MKTASSQQQKDDFITPARRAFRRVARTIRKENSRLGLPLILGKNGRVKLVKPTAS